MNFGNDAQKTPSQRAWELGINGYMLQLYSF